MTHEKQNLILRFWFGDDSLHPLSHNKMWFSKSPQFDSVIRQNFEGMVEEAASGAFDDWAKTPDGALALVILLDQFPRNIYRGDERAFALDDHARRIAEIALDLGHDKHLTAVERCFLYLPLEHSEDITAQERAVTLFDELARETHDGATPLVNEALSYAIRHRDIIARFGRFPHRNEALGRRSTNDEIEFLKRSDSTF